MLIVLATLVLVVTASVSVARIASTTVARRAVTARLAVADDVLGVTDGIILRWLAQESASVVLPPEATTPEVGVLHDGWIVNNTEYSLRITAWDQCGMVPVTVRRSGSPLWLAVPTEVRRLVDQTNISRIRAPGLDLFLEAAGRTESIDAFPRPAETHPLFFGDVPIDEATPPIHPASARPPDRLAIGAYVAAHNPGRINVNTAPMDLVKQAVRLMGRGDADRISEARSVGRSALVPAGPASASRGPSVLELAADSNAWAFRIDIGFGLPRGGSVRRSWWAVYVQSQSSWECVQRLAILE